MVSNVNSDLHNVTDDDANLRQSLLHWIESVSGFYRLRTELVTLINEQVGNGSGTASSRFVTQCSISQLIAIEAGMNRQLTYLLGDLNLPDSPPRPELLGTHIARLQAWNKRVKGALYMASLPAC